MGRIEKPAVDMRRLRYFVAVCDHGGFSRAATMIGIAQPALTRQVQLLEQDLGVELFVRNGRSAVPTKAGAVLMGQARVHLEGLDLLVDKVRRDFSAGPAQVSLGICPTIAPLFLGPLHDALQRTQSTLDLTVIEAYSGDLRHLMACGRLDLALTYSPDRAEGLASTDLLRERLVLAGPPGGVTESLSLQAVAGHALILPSRNHQLRRIIDDVAAARGVALEPALELDSLSAVKAMLTDTAGGYATILPYHAVAEDAAQGRLTIRMIDDPGMVRTIALLHPAGVLPEGLADHIFARADEIRASLAAVF